MKAVILILKHASILRLSNLSPESALAQAELDYQVGHTDLEIQDLLMASSQEHSVELFTAFIMATNISVFILTSFKIISHKLSVPFQSLIETHASVDGKKPWFKRVLEPLKKSMKKDKYIQC